MGIQAFNNNSGGVGGGAERTQHLKDDRGKLHTMQEGIAFKMLFIHDALSQKEAH